MSQSSTMTLNIKSEGTHGKARELARLTGESMTQAVDRAITERIDRLKRAQNRQAGIERLLAIGRECSRLPVLDARSADQMLYDKHGLPK